MNDEAGKRGVHTRIITNLLALEYTILVYCSR